MTTKYDADHIVGAYQRTGLQPLHLYWLATDRYGGVYGACAAGVLAYEAGARKGSLDSYEIAELLGISHEEVLALSVGFECGADEGEWEAVGAEVARRVFDSDEEE